MNFFRGIRKKTSLGNVVDITGARAPVRPCERPRERACAPTHERPHERAYARVRVLTHACREKARALEVISREWHGKRKEEASGSIGIATRALISAWSVLEREGDAETANDISAAVDILITARNRLDGGGIR